MIQKNVHQYQAKIAAIHTLRVNVKSLAAEAKLNRQEMRRAGPVYRSVLANHRKTKLREEARYAQLALAWVRDVPYRTVEQKTKNWVDVKRLREKIMRHFRRYEDQGNSTWDWTPTEQTLTDWLRRP